VWSPSQVLQAAWYRGTNTADGFNISGNATIDPGQGDDGVTFHDGDHTFVYNRGDGSDVYSPWFNYPNNTETLSLPDQTFADTYITAVGNDLLVTDLATNQMVRFTGWSQGAGYQGAVQFGDGTRLNNADLIYWTTAGDFSYNGTRGNDTIRGSFRDQHLAGGDGNDFIDGGSGSDTLSGGAGNDTMSVSVDGPGELKTIDGNDGNNTADFGNFSAAVSVDMAANTIAAQTRDNASLDSGTWRTIATLANIQNLRGSAFNDYLGGDGNANLLTGGAGNDTLDGRSGNDTLDGGAGNDLLIGGIGSDTFIFGLGYGADTIAAATDSGNDTVVFGAGITRSNLQISHTQTDMTIQIAGTSDSLTMQGEWAPASNVGDISRFVFADGSSASVLDLRMQALQAVNATEFLYEPQDGTVQVNVDGSYPWQSMRLDRISSSQVSLNTSANGRDLILRVNTGQTITLSNVLYGGLHLGTLTFADGNLDIQRVLPAVSSTGTAQLLNVNGDLVVNAPNGNLTLSGGLGNDTLIGGDMNNNATDRFIYASGDGNLDIEAHVYSWNTLNNTLQLTDLNASDVTIGRVNSTLQIQVNATGRILTVGNEFNSTNHDGIQQISFADGTVMTRDQITAAGWYRAGTGNVSLTAQNGNATMLAGTGNDTVTAGDMNNNAAVTFLYDSPDGNLDVESHVYPWNVLNNTLQLRDLNASDVTIGRNGSNLQIQVNATGRTVTVGGEFNSTNHDGIQQIRFADGSVMTRDQIAGAWYRAGFGNVTVTAQNGNATMVAGTGDDTLIAGDMNNNASDTFMYSAVDGNLSIAAHVYSWNTLANTLRLTDLNVSDVTLSRVNADLRVAINATGRVITVGNEFVSTNHDGIQQISFAAGTSMTRDQITAAAWYRAGAGNVTVTAQNGSATMLAGTGNDTLVGGDMNNNGAADTFIYASGDGNLDVEAHVYSWNSFNNTLQLSDLNASDVTLSRVNNDLHVAVNATGRVITVGNEFHSTTYDGIQQIAFADGTTLNRTQIQAQAYVRGTGGNDVVGTSSSPFGMGGVTFDLGKGNDSVYADWANNETVLYYAGDGNDTYRLWDGSASADVLQLPDLAPGDLTLHRNGNDLLIGFHNSADTITFTNEFTNNNYGINGISFGTGATWDRNYINSNLT
jgi:Ca2+-binding RTX toxin-like protein